ncbi:GUN4 domain-containing protein [Anabaena sp. AL09]|jgi:hypothetical protein|uniref:GUN4 domain-containing protein n=1 Tax=Anabaena sp. AL09 TaxID=1710891 RepID=UPI000A7ED224|nr:GUN4 domain-containing protein [Anabaena sp. AL09]
MIIWQPGQQINNGRFIIQGKPLGSGGFGTTYKALEPSTGKLYAIKTLNQQMQLQEDFAEQQVKFINEALTIKGFDHQHILKGLKSSCGMDYRKLRDYLAQGKWKEANEETKRVMLAVAKREKEGFLNIKSIDNFPCEDLRTIDQLWVKYSDGKFGFSVQKRIYQSFGGTREYNEEIWEKFEDKVGWRKGGNLLYYNDITFDKKAPEGHLPTHSSIEGRERYLFSRRDL